MSRSADRSQGQTNHCCLIGRRAVSRIRYPPGLPLECSACPTRCLPREAQPTHLKLPGCSALLRSAFSQMMILREWLFLSWDWSKKLAHSRVFRQRHRSAFASLSHQIYSFPTDFAVWEIVDSRAPSLWSSDQSGLNLPKVCWSIGL